MDVMVQWDDTRTTSSFARVSAVASPETLEAPTREIVTLYGSPTPEYLALASLTTGELRISEADGAIGDAEWHDRDTGEVIRRELSIPFTVLRETAKDLLAEGGQSIRRLLAGLLMPDWPEGTTRSLTFQLAVAGAPRTSDVLAAMREADADNFVDDA
jgi:hypothetical protein